MVAWLGIVDKQLHFLDFLVTFKGQHKQGHCLGSGLINSLPGQVEEDFGTDLLLL